MKWNEKEKVNLQWSAKISNYEEKLQVAKKIAQKVNDGDVIGFGSGSTSYVAVLEIGKRVKDENLKIKAIPTSQEIAFTCNELGIPVISLNDARPDWCFDGADEVDPNHHLNKGRGAAMFIEKLVMSASLKSYILVDQSKLVDKICTNFPIPVEIYPKALTYVKMNLVKLGAKEVVLRLAVGKDGPIVTESGNLILDVWFEQLTPTLEKDLKAITGVIESGLFMGYPVEIITV